jgi:hypothetical protein
MTTPTLPARLDLSATVEGIPLRGAIFEVELPMTRKNSYVLPIGVAGADGTLTIAGDEIARFAQQVNNLFLMDYVGLGAGWTGEIRVRPVNRDAIARLRSAYATWRDSGIYPPDFPAWLDDLEANLTPLHPTALIQVRARSEHPGTKVASTTEMPVGG